MNVSEIMANMQCSGVWGHAPPRKIVKFRSSKCDFQRFEKAALIRQKLIYLFDMPVYAKDYDCTPVLHTLLKRGRRSSVCSIWMCMSARDNSLSSTR